MSSVEGTFNARSTELRIIVISFWEIFLFICISIKLHKTTYVVRSCEGCYSVFRLFLSVISSESNLGKLENASTALISLASGRV